MKRRHFLQFSSSLFASLGLSQLDVMRQGDRYAKVLAQSTSRKLALLVGINDYQPLIGQLYGCTTDVDMQRELLVHRFGFNPKDILDVKDAQATREGILTAFNEHLIKQAKPGDVVVFHYSGHGSQVLDPDPINGEKYNSTMVPIDRPADSVASSDNPVSDIMGQTLFLLMSAVQTENLTVVLDSCYSGGGKRGNVVVRSARLPRDLTLVPTSSELEYQNQWISKLYPSKAEFLKLREKGVAKGVVIASARRDQVAADATYDGFSAGAFTYIMTRYLWNEARNSPFKSMFDSVRLRTIEVAQQNPEYEVEPESDNDSQPIYFLERTRPAADGVIRKVTGDRVEFWLGGLDSQSLEAFKEAIFSIIDDQGQEQGQIKLESRVELVGYGKVIQASQPEIVREGTLLRELVRGMPTDLTLRIGVDDSLGAEKAQAQAALQKQARVKPVAVGQQAATHYLLGKVTQEDFQAWQKQDYSNPPPVNSLGLFTSSKEPISGSFGQVGESAENAVLRLQPRFKVLLAGRILKSLTNSDSSELNVTTTIQAVDGIGTSGASRRGTRSAQAVLPPGVSSTQNSQFKRGTNIQAQITNNEGRNIYVSLLYITGAGNIVNFFPLDWEAPIEKSLVAAGQTINVPQPEDKFIWNVGKTAGTFEVLVLASTEPLRNALKGLQTIAQDRGTRSGDPMNVDEPVDIIGSLLGDIDSNSRSPRSGDAAPVLISKEVGAVSTKQFAAISIIVEVVD